jgi:uncharacterized protein (DUF488 family)
MPVERDSYPQMGVANNILFTAGYEAVSVDDFIVAMKVAGIRCVLDIRAVAASRKPGFSKTSFEAKLARAGLSYIHLRSLGDPKPGRDAARAGETEKFQAIYRQHLSTSDAQQGLREVAAQAVASAACLLCYEREPMDCHRSIVAEALEKSDGFVIKHLRVGWASVHAAARERRALGRGAGSSKSRSAA